MSTEVRQHFKQSGAKQCSNIVTNECSVCGEPIEEFRSIAEHLTRSQECREAL